MTPELPHNPNLEILPLELAVCAVIILIGLACLYAWERRHPDGSAHTH